MSKTTVATGGIADSAVATAKIADSAVTAVKTSELTGSVVGEWRLTTDLTVNNNSVFITSNWEEADTSYSRIGSAMTESSGEFTFPSTGIYRIDYSVVTNTNSNVGDCECWIAYTSDNSSYNTYSISGFNHDGESTDRANAHCRVIFDVTNTSTHKIKFAVRSAAGVTFKGSSSYNRTYATFMKLGAT